MDCDDYLPLDRWVYLVTLAESRRRSHCGVARGVILSDAQMAKMVEIVADPELRHSVMRTDVSLLEFRRKSLPLYLWP